MPPKRCAVSFVDENGIEHTTEVFADSVYEAAALALRAFHADSFVHEKPTPGTTLNVRVFAASQDHSLRVGTLAKWVERVPQRPFEKLERDRIRHLLS